MGKVNRNEKMSLVEIANRDASSADRITILTDSSRLAARAVARLDVQEARHDLALMEAESGRDAGAVNQQAGVLLTRGSVELRDAGE